MGPLSVSPTASTDNTINIATQYPIIILQLRREWRHTPAAGRYIGFRKSSGEFILFLDGDSFLVEGFVEKSIEYFKENNSVEAIIGKRKEIYYDGEIIVGEERDINNIGENTKLVRIAPSSAIYRRSALDEVGCFNPYLFAEEEAELSDRLKRGGFKVMGIPWDMVVHNTLPREKIKTLFQRMKCNFHLGDGQIIRYALKRPISVELFKRVSSGLRFLIWSTGGLVLGILSFIFKRGDLIFLWVVLCGVLFIVFALKSKSVLKPIRYLLIWSLQSYALVRGFLMKPFDPESYPTDVLVIKM